MKEKVVEVIREAILAEVVPLIDLIENGGVEKVAERLGTLAVSDFSVRLANLAEVGFGVVPGTLTIRGLLRDVKMPNERDKHGDLKPIQCIIEVGNVPEYRLALAEMDSSGVNLQANQFHINDAIRSASAEEGDKDDPNQTAIDDLGFEEEEEEEEESDEVEVF